MLRRDSGDLYAHNSTPEILISTHISPKFSFFKKNHEMNVSVFVTCCSVSSLLHLNEKFKMLKPLLITEKVLYLQISA